MKVDDDHIIKNYRHVFTSSMCESLPAPAFKSRDNADFYDRMIVDGLYTQLEWHVSDPKKKSKGTDQMKEEKRQAASFETLEEDVAQLITKISEKRPELSV